MWDEVGWCCVMWGEVGQCCVRLDGIQYTHHCIPCTAQAPQDLPGETTADTRSGGIPWQRGLDVLSG